MDNIQWLLENGSTSIKLQMIKEGLINKNEYDKNLLAEELLQIEKIKIILSYFDQFIEFRSMKDRDLWGIIHNCYENCFEQFGNFFVKIGFGKGISIFDEKIEIMRDVYKYLMETYPFHGLNIICILLNAGYWFDDMDSYIINKINENHKITSLNMFDFYETDINKIRQYNKWKDKLIVKDIFNPHGSEYPLPTNYDIELFLAYYHVTENETMKAKIDDIMRFMLHSEYQKTGGNNGWHWAEREKTYHASSAGWSLPMYDNCEPKEIEKWHFLRKLEINSLSPIITESEYFYKCMGYLEQYKTKTGTYIFPDKYMFAISSKPFNASLAYDVFISKTVLSTLKRNRRKAFLHEVYSTFYMAMIKNRFQRVE